ncbi:MAG TPA: maleylpyruvate isomerase N-terminal domain-containing protein [Thermomicrobiales bacterium]|nr:maleylpyruvate isomerase N-terminal domain-containing protein [Thermomicrobiales bacterium]
MQPPGPVLVLDLYPAERARLLALLRGLTGARWDAPTACPGWSVKDLAAHLLADDLGRLSRRRDGYTGWAPRPGEGLLAFVNRQNEEWVQGARRLSPGVLCDLLAWSGDRVAACFAALDQFATGGPVSWAGPAPAPVWLDVAREYTERWHHQQHIREAVGAPPLDEPCFFAPVLATFARALPHALRGADAPAGTAVGLCIRGTSGGDWTAVREVGGWTLYAGAAAAPAARVALDEALAWRLFTRGVAPDEAAPRAALAGDQALCRLVLEMVAIVA